MPKTVLITGASRGLGLEFVQQYAEDGWSVLASARNPEEPADLLELAGSFEGQVKVAALDVSSDDSVQGYADSLREHPVDLLINNAGIMGDTSGIDAIEPEEIARVFDTNVLGCWRMTKAFLPHLEGGEGKKIAFVTSMMGSIGDGPGGHYYPYRISKSALNMLGANLAADLRAKGISTVLLHPGWVRTRMGGGAAPTSIPDSVKGMRDVIDRLTLSDSGKFFHAEGHECPW